MGTRFVKYHPAVRRNEREKFYFIVAAGAAISLLLLTVLVLHNRSADATMDKQAVQRPADPIRPTIGTVTLLAPERDVPKGTKLSTVKLKEIYWPRNRVPQGAIRSRAEVQSLYAKVNLIGDMPLIRSNLTHRPTHSPLPVRPGFRAITISVDATSGLEGHALPGTFVDVLLTYDKDGKKVTKIIVQNARVLSYGGKVEAEETIPLSSSSAAARAAYKRILSSTITLEVTPQDALKIQTAKNMGQLGLMMRPVEDTGTPEITEIDENGVEGNRPAKRVSKAAGCSKGHVRISGREYLVNCDGSITQVLDPYEP